MENHKDNRDYLWFGTYEEHKAEIEDKNHLLFVGMHRDGVLRQNYKAERGYLDQIFYSLLKSD